MSTWLAGVRFELFCLEVLCDDRRFLDATAAGAVATMRAAAHVHYLAERYNWPIEADERAVGCTDGRVATVSAYKLPADCIHAARAGGARRWIAEVKAARATLRAKAADAYRSAAAMNKAYKRRTDNPGQRGLFDGDAE